MDASQQIVSYIRQNKISTTEVADCLGKTGLFENAYAVVPGMFRVGKVKWVYAYHNSNWSIHEQIRDVQPGQIVMIEAFGCENRATVGALVAKYILLYRQAEAIISNANMRDGNDLLKERYAVWCRGFSPIGCYNTKNKEPLDPMIYNQHYHKYEGSIAVCDDSGVVLVPKELQTDGFLKKLHEIEDQEDIWFECLDHKKWNTYDIVCGKKYLHE